MNAGRSTCALVRPVCFCVSTRAKCLEALLKKGEHHDDKGVINDTYLQSAYLRMCSWIIIS